MKLENEIGFYQNNHQNLIATKSIKSKLLINAFIHR